MKVTLVSTQQAAAYYDPDKSRGAYATRDAYLADLVDFTRREIAELIRLGCEYIQIDAPQYAALLDETMREGYRQRGSDPDKMIEACLELDNAIIADHPAGVTIAQQVFGRARFEPLRHVPDDRVVVLGLVSSRKAAMESPDELKARIAEASRIVPLERLALSAQCGFASTHEGNSLTADEQRRKLELVASTAREVWGSGPSPG